MNQPCLVRTRPATMPSHHSQKNSEWHILAKPWVSTLVVGWKEAWVWDGTNIVALEYRVLPWTTDTAATSCAACEKGIPETIEIIHTTLDTFATGITAISACITGWRWPIAVKATRNLICSQHNYHNTCNGKIHTLVRGVSDRATPDWVALNWYSGLRSRILARTSFIWC